MAAVAMVTKVQKMLNSLQAGDPFETWHKNRTSLKVVQPFWKNQPLKAQLHMAYDIPTRFYKVWSRHLLEMCRTNFWRKKERRIITRIAIA
jgi:hypothetical protein